MITGFNTDVSYGGEVFHVQTEDKGIQSPIILSLVYRAGTILAAKRTAYDRMIQNGIVDEQALAQMLSKQHQLLVAAIKSGKSDKLAELSRQRHEQKSGTVSPAGPQPGGVVAAAKKPAVPPAQNTISVVAAKPQSTTLSPQNVTVVEVQSVPVTIVNAQVIGPEKNSVAPPAVNSGVKVQPLTPAVPPPLVVSLLPETQAAQVPVVGRGSEAKTVETISFDQIIAGYLQPSKTPDQLRIELLYPSKFSGGDEVTVRAAVLFGGHSPANNAVVKIQLLGTRIDPQIWTAKTDFQGLVNFHVKIPNFTCGAAALVLTAREPGGQEVEVKHMIRKK